MVAEIFLLESFHLSKLEYMKHHPRCDTYTLQVSNSHKTIITRFPKTPLIFIRVLECLRITDRGKAWKNSMQFKLAFITITIFPLRRRINPRKRMSSHSKKSSLTPVRIHPPTIRVRLRQIWISNCCNTPLFPPSQMPIPLGRDVASN